MISCFLRNGDFEMGFGYFRDQMGSPMAIEEEEEKRERDGGTEKETR